MSMKTYLELSQLKTFEERFKYLRLSQKVSEETFGHLRWVNQKFYKSKEWLSFRNQIIVRDMGCDLGVPGRDIYGPIIIHHLNPITYDDLINRSPCVFDKNNVITTMLSTHNAIHYGDVDLLLLDPIERTPNDTIPWKVGGELKLDG